MVPKVLSFAAWCKSLGSFLELRKAPQDETRNIWLWLKLIDTEIEGAVLWKT